MKKLLKVLSAALIICILMSIFIGCSPKEYVLTISENGHTYNVVVKVGDSYTLKNPDSREGYNFVGWYYGDKLLSNTFTPTSDMKINGVWERYDKLAEELKISLKAYLSSEEFSKSIIDAKTTQARLPLLYLRYVQGNYYTNEVVMLFKQYLNMINGIIDNGSLEDSLYPSSDAGKQGWYGILDYLYSWSIIYNQYQHWCYESNNADTSYSIYFEAIKGYLSYVDSFYDSKEYDFNGGKAKLSDIMTSGTNCVNNFTGDKYRLPYDVMAEILTIIKNATGKNNGHDIFLAKYKTAVEGYDDMTKEERNEAKTELQTLWNSCIPNTKVSWGYDIQSVLTITAYNLGLSLSDTVPCAEEFMLSYYDKDDDGNWKKDGGTSNWVGFSGRPLAGSIFRNNERYDVAYEKTMQGYFPFTDGWDQPLDEMINMDRLCNFYNKDLETGAYVEPFYGILYGFMNGIDMEHYVKEVYHNEVCAGEGCKYHIEEEDGQIYNIITLWRESLKKDDDGNYIIGNTSDMAIAIAYCAMVYGIEAPSPLGLYSSQGIVIDLG